MRGSKVVRRSSACAFLVSLALVACGHERKAQGQDAASLQVLARHALSEDRTISVAAIRDLRARGPAGLEALFSVHADGVAQLRADPAAALHTLEGRALRDALDQVAMQRDAFASGLFWYTDQIAAQHEAKRTGKRVLSLRMLGRLDQELSCANSRLFRTVLYLDLVVQQEIARHYVLHWSSERPAPVITIDMGDGRRVVRTITGNSVHYVLSPDGETIDAIPGMESPAAFVEALEDANAIANACEGGRDRTCIAAQHQSRREALEQALREALRPLGIDAASIDLSLPRRERPPTVNDAEGLTAGKAVIERPSLALMARDPGALSAPLDVWSAIGGMRTRFDLALRRDVPDVVISQEAVAMIRFKSAASQDTDVVRIRLLGLIANDTARNRFLQHARVHALFMGGQAERLSDLNATIYADLFLTPASDRWLGLMGDDLFTGIDPAIEHPAP